MILETKRYVAILRLSVFLCLCCLLLQSPALGQSEVTAPPNPPKLIPSLQPKANSDTTRRLLKLEKKGEAIPDTLIKPDTTQIDSTKPKSDLDTTVSYTASKIEMYADTKLTILTGKAVVRYRTMELRAHKITVDWDHNMVYAEGRPDTLWMDTTATQVDTIIQVETPLFLDHSSTADSLRGVTMEMNLKTQKGRVFVGTSATEQGRYRGSVLKRVESQVMYVKNGDFTTCETVPSHYHFHSSDMKVVYRDKLIARPVSLYFGEVPVAIIPYAVFSLKPGRHSGLIFPAYGESASSGRYFRHLGYYWAPNDYWDSKMTLDYYEKMGTVWNFDNRYAQRYYLNGDIYGMYNHLSGRTHWEGHWSHSHQIDPTMRITGDVNYYSDQTLQQNLSTNINDLLTQEARSTISMQKNWVDSRASMSMALTGRQNIRNRNYDLTMPSLNFNWGTGPIFTKSNKGVASGFGGPPVKNENVVTNSDGSTTTLEPAWWETITYNYNLSTVNSESGSRPYRTILTYDTSSYETPHSGIPDTTVEQYWNRTKVQYAHHTSSINAPQKVLKYFTVNPSVSLSQEWSPELLAYYFENDTILNSRGKDSVIAVLTTKKKRGFYTRTVFNSSVGVGTKIYGFFDPKGLFGLNGIRHVLTPNVGINYQPNFADKPFGIMQRLKNPFTGREFALDPWSNYALGGTPNRKSLSMGMSANNVFQARYEKGEETKKVDLFTWDLSTGYTFTVDSMNWSPVAMSWRAAPFSGGTGLISSVAIDIGTNYSFYKYAYTTPASRYGTPVNKFYWNKNNWYAPLRFTSGTANFSFNWQKPQPTVAQKDTTKPVTTTGSDLPQLTKQIQGSTDPFSGGNLLDYRPIVAGVESKWSGGSSLYLSYGVDNPKVPIKQAKLSNSISINITPTWSLGTGLTVDLINHQVDASEITTHKDLHCWEISFNWNPRGIGQGFYLRINVKSADLQDLKIEKDKSRGGFFSPGSLMY